MRQPTTMARSVRVGMGAGFIVLATLGCGAELSGSRASEGPHSVGAAEPANTLSPEEQADGWRLLFDGQTTSGWRKVHGDGFPEMGWEVRDGALVVRESGSAERRGGDIVTIERYSDFDLKIDFNLRPGANSGIKYMVDERLGTPGHQSAIGLEYQLIDDFGRADAESIDGKGRLGALYDLIAPPGDKPFAGADIWHTARIVARGRHVEHWLNGTKLIEFERGSPDFRRRVNESKFKSLSGFGEVGNGHILLQDHGDGAAFRNIKMKLLQQRTAG